MLWTWHLLYNHYKIMTILEVACNFIIWLTSFWYLRSGKRFDERKKNLFTKSHAKTTGMPRTLFLKTTLKNGFIYLLRGGSCEQ